MEHRWYRRICPPLSVNLYTNEGFEIRNCRIANISLGGMLVILAAQDRCLDDSINNGVINVELHEKHFDAMLPALILRRNARTLAVMFVKHHSGMQAFLSRLRMEQENNNQGNRLVENERLAGFSGRQG